jgi:DNA-binding transcriptional MerR regulator
MGYTMSDLQERSGLSARTIRDYISSGYVNPPRGRGTAAEYDEESLLQVVSVARMRKRGESWSAVAEIAGWSLEELRAFVKKTEPPAPDPPPPPDDPPALEGEPVSRARLPRGGASPKDLSPGSRTSDAELPAGARWVLAPLLPGLVLMVKDDVSPLVRRAAAEIIERYGA